MVNHSNAANEVSALIIHQIRGNEMCCMQGNLKMIERIFQDPELQKLPLSWALRYDVLTDSDAVASFSGILMKQNVGVLLEVTPLLASASGVIYRGLPDGSDWYHANHAFLVGYSISERKRLIDTIIGAYRELFHANPLFSVSWIIDSWSLEYLNKQYGIKLHELTKEQFETDGYTLYGGVFNIPYVPRLKHPLLPARNTNDMLDLVVVRQTVSDIEKNYGSAKAYYTSQPNDYLKSPYNQRFSYFTQLVEQVVSQEDDNAFGLFGLENSREWESYQEEYLSQLKFLAEKQIAGTLKILNPQEVYVRYKGLNSSVKMLKSADFPKSGVLWYFGSTYRARVEILGDHLVLTDFRVYADDLEDPYRNEPANKSRVYWIAPYLLDSSQQFEQQENAQTNIFAGDQVRRDEGVTRFGIDMMAGNFKLQSTDGKFTILSNSGSVSFTPQYIDIASGESVKLLDPIALTVRELFEINTDQYVHFRSHPRFFLHPDRIGETIEMGWENYDLEPIVMASFKKTTGNLMLIPNTKLSQIEIRSLASIFQPDRSPYRLDLAHTTFYWHNHEAIAGRNPVRLFIDPRNVLDRPVSVKTVTHPDLGNIQVTLPPNLDGQMDSFYIDFTSVDPISKDVRLSIDGNILPKSEKITFYSDCTLRIYECVTNPHTLISYVKLFVNEQRGRLTIYLSDYFQKIISHDVFEKGKILFDETIAYILEFVPAIYPSKLL